MSWFVGFRTLQQNQRIRRFLVKNKNVLALFTTTTKQGYKEKTSKTFVYRKRDTQEEEKKALKQKLRRNVAWKDLKRIPVQNKETRWQ